MIYGEAKYMIQQLTRCHNIYRPFKIDGKDYLILAVLEADDEDLLLIMRFDEGTITPDPDLFEESQTNREQMNKHHQMVPDNQLNIDWISIGAQKLYVSGSTSTYNLAHSEDFGLWIDYLKKQGSDIELVLTLETCVLELFLKIDGFSRETPLEVNNNLVIKTCDSFKQIQCHRQLKLPIGDYEEPLELAFLEDEICYINGISFFDKKAELEKVKCGVGKYETLRENRTESEVEEIIAMYQDAWDSLMADDEYSAIITYETTLDGSLDFKLTSFLDAAPLRNNKNRATIMLIKADKKFGRKGLPLKSSILGPVKMGTEGPLSVEIIQVMKRIKGEVYTFNT